MRNFQFTKRERIVSKKLIEQMFSRNGSHSLAAFPLRIVYMQRERPEGEPAVQLLLSVSKRHFKHAVDRNRVKRQLREAYRLNRSVLTDSIPVDKQLLVSFVWLSDSLLSTEVVAARVRGLMKKVAIAL